MRAILDTGRRASPATIPVLLCADAAYAQHAAVCLVSLLESNRRRSFDVVVATTEPLGDAEDRLRRSAAPYPNCTLSFRPVDGSASLRLPITEHYTKDAYSRLWVADYFPDDVDKVLYLDSDMVVVADIGELWNWDLGDAVIGAVTIPGSNRCPIYGIPERYGYFNSGVMLIDLARWRDERILDRLIDYIERHQAIIAYADQDVLNACLYDRRAALPLVWNVIAPFYFNQHPLGIPPADLRQIRRDARIIHFNGASKPWSYMSRHPRRGDYWKYLRRTEWRDYTWPDRSALNWAKKYFGPFIPEAVRTWIKGPREAERPRAAARG